MEDQRECQDAGRSCEKLHHQGTSGIREVQPCLLQPFRCTRIRAGSAVATKEMDREQIWWLMTKEQRLALLMDEACAHQSRKAESLTLKASGNWSCNWYQTCLQAIRQGSNAIAYGSGHPPQ